MGGTCESIIGGIRFHVQGLNVHAHDDQHRLKFSCERKKFKKEVASAFKSLEGQDAVIQIESTEAGNTGLCIAREGGKYFTFLRNPNSVKSDLQNFLKGF